MTYRAPTFRELEGRVTYGPFPIKKARIFGAIASLVMMCLSVFFALDEQTLVCDAAGRCAATHWGEVREFPAAALASVRVDIETGSKNAKYGVVVLHFSRGEELRLMRVTPGEAEEAAATVRVGIDAHAPFAVSLHNPRWLLVFSAILLVVAISLFYSGIRGLGRFSLVLAQGGAALDVTRKVLGIPVARERAGLEGIVDVAVETGLLPDGWRSRGQPLPPGGRIVLVDRAGARHPLTEKLYPGRAVHLRGAARLRALLRFEPRPGGVEEELAALPLVTTKLGMRIAFAWPGLTVGLLAGIPLAALVRFAVGSLHRGDPVDELTFGSGAIGGAILGVCVSLYLTRARPQR